MGPRVVWGWGDVMETFASTSRLTRVDLPTFGRPRTATKPLLKPFFSVTGSPDRKRVEAAHRAGSARRCRNAPHGKQGAESGLTMTASLTLRLSGSVWATIPAMALRSAHMLSP